MNRCLPPSCRAWRARPPSRWGEFVKTLEYKGWLERRDDPNNRRVLLISTTPEGRAVLMRCEAAVDQTERDFFQLPCSRRSWPPCGMR